VLERDLQPDVMFLQEVDARVLQAEVLKEAGCAGVGLGLEEADSSRWVCLFDEKKVRGPDNSMILIRKQFLRDLGAVKMEIAPEKEGGSERIFRTRVKLFAAEEASSSSTSKKATKKRRTTTDTTDTGTSSLPLKAALARALEEHGSATLRLGCYHFSSGHVTIAGR